MGPILIQKIFKGGSHFGTQIAKKNVKSTFLEAEKPLEMGLDLQTFQKTV